MSGRTYDLVYLGRLRPGTDTRKAARIFAASARLSFENAHRLLTDGRSRVLRRNLSEDAAERYRRPLEMMGLMVEFEAGSQGAGLVPKNGPVSMQAYREQRKQVRGPSDQAVNKPGQGSEEQHAPREADEAACPKCGSPNISEGVCMDCGILVSFYYAAG